MKYAVLLLSTLWILSGGPGARPGGGGQALAGDADPRSPRAVVGLQLFSLRAEMAKDLPGALKRARAMGVREVEGSCPPGTTPGAFRKLLDDAGLVCTSIHAQYGELQHGLEEVAAEAKTLGARYVICPWIPHKGGFSLEEARTAAAHFNQWGKALAGQGLVLGYHPHGFEFAPTPDGTAFDVLVRETDPRHVVFELDVFWAYQAGQDPAELLRKHPDRFALLHLKDMKAGTPRGEAAEKPAKEASVAVGTGEIDFRSLMSEAKKIGVKHYYIEDESPEAAKQIPQSLQYLGTLGLPTE